MSDFFCEPCKKNIKEYNRNRHETSKGHKIKYDKFYTEEKYTECTICAEEKISITKIKICEHCKQHWCHTCDKQIGKCPFCRGDIIGKEDILERQRIERFEEYERNLLTIYSSGNIQEDIDQERFLEYIIRILQIINSEN